MASIVRQLADALVARLAALEWSGVPYVARRTYASVEDEQLGDRSGDVDVAVIVPSAYESIELDTRASVERTVIVRVVVRAKLGPADADGDTGKLEQDRIDDLVALSEFLSTAAIYARLTDYPDARFSPPAEHDPIYRPDHLRELRQFTSVIAVTFAIDSPL